MYITTARRLAFWIALVAGRDGSLLGIAVVVSVVILWWLKQSPRSQKMLPIAFAFILGGALGNVYDRLVHGYVIDFLDFYVNNYHWPAFNIADSAIFIGAALLIIDMIKNGEKREGSESKGHVQDTADNSETSK